uniref:Tudor domain-containing protein n=1 Tax=Rhabditophanes sp. KR3021 TaxID=114890 RepID=A0AC35U275_9BILA
MNKRRDASPDNDHTVPGGLSFGGEKIKKLKKFDDKDTMKRIYKALSRKGDVQGEGKSRFRDLLYDMENSDKLTEQQILNKYFETAEMEELMRENIEEDTDLLGSTEDEFDFFTKSHRTVSLLYQSNRNVDVLEEITNMTWTEFEDHCMTSRANTIANQIECSQLKGTAIHWKGTVQLVRITGIENSFESLLDYLPDSIEQAIRCFYDTDTSDVSTLSRIRPNECSMTSFNVYSYEIDVSGPYGENRMVSTKGQIILSAGDAFAEILTLLEEGDVVQFVGFFDQYPIFRYPPKLQLAQLDCVTCKQLIKNKHNRRTAITFNQNSKKRRIWNQVLSSFKYLFNFVCAPVVILKD